MTLHEIAALLEGTLRVEGEHAEGPIRHVLATNMMSEVLLAEEDELLLVTTLDTEHPVRTAHVLGIPGIVFAGTTLKTAVERTARDLGIGLVVSPLPADEVLRRVRPHLKGD